MRARVLLLVAVGVSIPLVAGAGPLLRCVGPDGKMVYTDDKSVCPDAEPFEPQGRVVSSTARPRPAPRAPRARNAAGQRNLQIEEAEAARWKAKKAAKLAELEAIDRRRSELKRFVQVCNRRGRIVSYDDAGIEKEVPCSQIQARFKSFDAEEAKVREYLENGLADECRKAGCLPGWIR